MKKKILWIIGDLIIAALVVLVIWIIDYKIPQKGIEAVSPQKISENRQMKKKDSFQKKDNSSQQIDSFPQKDNFLQQKDDSLQKKNGFSQKNNFSQQMDTSSQQMEEQDFLQRTDVIMDAQDWHKKFADKFTDTVVAKDLSYTSPDLAIQLFYNQYDTGRLDRSNSGKHEKYGTKVSYILADIYIGDITCFQTAFAQDIYGVGYSEKLSDMSKRMKSVLAVNGDSYSNNRHKDNGTIIRNGVVYRSQRTDAETCVLNWDGTIDIYSPNQIDLQQLIERGAYQSWIFGPSLLDENGKAKKSFLTWDYIKESHPRTALGYYEPGHYCLLLVDGRQDSSRGMFLDEMAKVFEDLGCKAAYNLDGGHCSFMNFQGQTANHPYKSEHEVMDGIFIKEGLE